MSGSEANLTAALTLVRRMPPSSVENCLAGLLVLDPELTDDLLNNVDVPLKHCVDPQDGRAYIMCDFNRDGDAYRSPWSNQYYEADEDGKLQAVEGELFPRNDLRALEDEANAIFDVYRHLYFHGGFSSVYFFETEEGNTNAWGCCFLIHKDVPETKNLRAGFWDSTHVFDCKMVSPGKYKYQLTSAVMVSMQMADDSIGSVDLSGNMSRQQEKTITHKPGDTHVSLIGRMLEEMELTMRNDIEGVYIQKTREVVNGMRNPDQAKMKAWEGIQSNLRDIMDQRNAR